MLQRNPTGRLDVLAVRLAERAVGQFDKETGLAAWPAVRPWVERQAERLAPTSKTGLGILPIIWAIAAGASAIGAGAGLWTWKQSSDYEDWKTTVPKPAPAPAPAAPKTTEQLKTWTPAAATTANAAALDEWKKTALDAYKVEPENYSGLVAAGALAAVSVLMLMKD